MPGDVGPEPRDDVLLSREEETRWLQAAADFEVNADFDVSAALASKGGALNFPELLSLMKTESKGKSTIQALGDKILLGKMLDNLGIPQMPMLFACHGSVDKAEVEELVRLIETSTEEDAFDIVVKPTHLSSSVGTLILSRESWIAGAWDSSKLVAHMEHFLAVKADDSESEALKSLRPGFVVQKCYRSSVQFNAPLEMRVVTLWGKAHVGIWWWGAGHPRTSWLVPCAENARQEEWEVLHCHTGYNPGFDAALNVFRSAMPAMAAAAEAIAKATGAPFLRSDFFVGSSKWGIRLNEVAYGSGCFLARKQAVSGTLLAVDDGPRVSHILQAGYKVAKFRSAALSLAGLGARGTSYETDEKDMSGVPGLHIDALVENAPKIPLATAQALAKFNCAGTPAVAECNCRTMIFAPPSRAVPVSQNGAMLQEASQKNEAMLDPRCFPLGTSIKEAMPGPHTVGTPSVRTFSVAAAMPQELIVSAPAVSAPGQVVTVMGPVGPIAVPLPNDVEPGQHFAVNLCPPNEDQELMVPNGARAGDRFWYKGTTGESREVEVPHAMLPGQKFRVSNALLVAIPDGASPGDILTFLTPRREQFNATVPAGKVPGQYLWVHY